MKKLLVILLILITYSYSNARCYIHHDSIMYFNPERFLLVVDMLSVSSPDGIDLIINDINSGAAVIVKSGTPIDNFDHIGSMLISVKIQYISLIGFISSLKCE